MKSASELLGEVNDFLARLPYDRQPSSLYEPVKYVLSMGGKRMRPVLMLLAYNLYKDDPESILMQAVGLETYHNYTLLHDDLMDNADLRRGHETVHKRWNANQAILSGDSMLVLAYQRMAECPADKLPQVLELFTTTALEIGEGQQYDIDFETRTDVSEEEYLEMIRLKTSVLLACALKMGALLAGAPHDDAERWPERLMMMPSASISSASLSVWPSSCKTTISMSMVMKRCLEKPSAATSPAIRRLSCSSMLTITPTLHNAQNWIAGSRQRISTGMKR